MYKFGNISRKRLDTCDFRIIEIMEKALSYGVMDFSVLEGHRSKHRQKELYDEGKSQLNGSDKVSFHQHMPSLAVDVVPYPIDWDNIDRFCILAGLIKAAASELGYKLEWGGDWNTFKDYPHYQINC